MYFIFTASCVNLNVSNSCLINSVLYNIEFRSRLSIYIVANGNDNVMINLK